MAHRNSNPEDSQYTRAQHSPSCWSSVDGWLLLMLAIALGAGIMSRVAAAVAAVLLLQIVISRTVTAGLPDLTFRDVGALGLAIMLTGPSQQRLALTR